MGNLGNTMTLCTYSRIRLDFIPKNPYMTLFWFHYHFQIKENTKLLNIRNLLRPQLHQFLAHRINKISLYYIKTWSWDEKISIFNKWVYEILQIFKRVPKKKSVRNFLGPESPTVASKRSKRYRSIFFEAGSTCGLQFYNFIIGPEKS